MNVIAFLVLNLLLIVGDGAKILGILPSSSKSHFIYPNALLQKLAASGHKVTVMSPFPTDGSSENYTTIDISEIKQQFQGRINALFTKENMQMNLFSKFKFLYHNTLIMTNITLQHPELKKLMESGETYDLIILDMFLTDALLGLSTVFDCPIVVLSANGPHEWVNELWGPPRPISNVPHMYTDFTERMNLGRRLENAIFYFLEKVLLQIYHLPQQEQLYNQVFSGAGKTFDEVRKSSIVIALVNSRFSISFPKPFLPNTIEVDGMQINEDILRPLPEDVKQFIENSEHGVIYFSLGRSIKPSMFTREKKQDLVKALSSLKFNTIWQLDDDSLNVDPMKIMVREWLPQYEILSHQKTVLFITNCGIMSCTEAIYFAKNMIAVPIYGHQPQNARKLANAKYGVHLNIFNFTGKSLTWAVEEVLSNQMYLQSIQEASQSFRDKSFSALETGKFWVEHVLLNKSISDVRPLSLQLDLIELDNFDVYFIILTVVMLMISIPAFMLKKLITKSYEKLLNSLAKPKTN